MLFFVELVMTRLNKVENHTMFLKKRRYHVFNSAKIPEKFNNTEQIVIVLYLLRSINFYDLHYTVHT